MKAENSKDDVAAVQKALYKMIDQASERWYLKNEIPSLGRGARQDRARYPL